MSMERRPEKSLKLQLFRCCLAGWHTLPPHSWNQKPDENEAEEGPGYMRSWHMRYDTLCLYVYMSYTKYIYLFIYLRMWTCKRVLEYRVMKI